MRTLECFDPHKKSYHPQAEALVNVLMQECENECPSFFRTLVAYYFAKVAATMRTEIKLHNNKILPVNIYAINLAPSGAGKGKSKNFVEDHVLHRFQERFKEDTLPVLAETNIAKIAHRRAVQKNVDPDEEMKAVMAEFRASGEWLSEFDSATPAALKQFRHKLLLASAGSLNFEIDEIGDNLTGNAEAFSKFLELYDKGKIKESLTKNTRENIRLSEVHGMTPCNMLMFGTPSSLLDGSKTEEEFYAMLEKGYARRCLFSFSRDVKRNLKLSAREIQQQRSSVTNYQIVDDLADTIERLASPANYKQQLSLLPDEEILLIEYSMHCRDRADRLGEFDVILRTELEHRHFKAMKLAAAFAFIDGKPTITTDHLYYAITLVEESGDQLRNLLSRDRPYVKLAKYLGEKEKSLTQVDLTEDLPFYKGSIAQKAEMLSMAIAWGYSNHIIIKKSYQDGIEFLKGESLKQTDTNKLIVSYSDHVAFNYLNEQITWEQLQILTQANGYHWTSHHALDGHRCEEKAIPGFNLIVIDVDGDIPLNTARELLKEYKALYYTTKRHGDNGEDRYRIVLPMKYVLKLDRDDYKEFMQNIYEWLPFTVDDQTNQRARKWLSNQGTTYVNDGILFDPLEFIPKTTKNETRKKQLMDQQSLNNLERWFINNTGNGNRSNQLVKYALLLVDSGMSLIDVEKAVLALNHKLADKLPEVEIHQTIMVSAQKAIHSRNTN